MRRAHRLRDLLHLNSVQNENKKRANKKLLLAGDAYYIFRELSHFGQVTNEFHNYNIYNPNHDLRFDRKEQAMFWMGGTTRTHHSSYTTHHTPLISFTFIVQHLSVLFLISLHFSLIVLTSLTCGVIRSFYCW